jgi:tRNA A22 N-methylase
MEIKRTYEEVDAKNRDWLNATSYQIKNECIKLSWQQKYSILETQRIKT